jgi:hypothetical protein
MWRDIFVAAINKGQFPLAIVGLIILSLIWKMPARDILQLFYKLAGEFAAYHFMGWILTVVISLGWFLHARHQRNALHAEITRVSGERNFYQDKLISGNLSTAK